MRNLLKELKAFAIAGITMGLAITPVFAGSIPTEIKDALGGGLVANPVPTPEPVAEVTKGGVTIQYTTLPDAFDAIGENGTGTVKLLMDIDLGLNGVAYVPNGSDFTLDLNGKRIFQTEDEDLAPITYPGGTNGKLTIDDSVGGGGITVNRASSALAETNLNLHAVCCGGADGSLTVNGGTFAVTNNNGSAVIFYKEGSGTWTFKGGTYLAGSEGTCSAQFLFCWGSSGKTFVTGGTYSIEAKDDSGIGIYVANEGTEQIEITAGDFDISTKKDWSPVFEFYGTCVINGGTFDITSLATGAIGFNVKEGGLLIVSNGTFSVSAANNAANCLNATANSRLEVAGGTFSAVSGTGEGYVSCATIVGNQDSSVVITGAPVINQPTGGANDNFMVSVAGARLDFTGYTYEWLGSIFVSNEGNTGFVKGDMSKCWWLSTTGGHFSVRPLEGKYWCADDMKPVVSLEEATKDEYPWVIAKAVAELEPGSGTNYTHVADALTAASNGQTVKLITDVTENVTLEAADKTNTLDLAGWVLKGDGTASVIQVVEGNLTISDSNPASVHYYKVDTNGVWVWQAEFSGTENYTFSIADGLRANGVATDDIPTTNDVIAVKGGAITGGSGTPEGTTTYGGGVCVLENGALTVNAGTIVGNRLACEYVAGGGIYIHGKNGGQYTLTNCALVGNVGGGLYCDYGAYALTSCHAAYNHAPDGGGVYLKENGMAVIKDVKIIGNVVGSDASGAIGTASGGGVNARGALTMSDCIVRRNLAWYGGGICTYSTAAITNCIVANNTATVNSGGITVNHGTGTTGGILTVKGGEISGNATIGDGGGMYVTSGSLDDANVGAQATLIDVAIFGNTSGKGGAVCIADAAEVLMNGCTVTNNTATTSGGGICKLGSDNDEGAVGKCVLIETEITGNAAGENGGGVYFRKAATCLAAGTRVAMADGTTKAIEDVKEGDFVRTFDHEGGTNSTARVYLAYKGETKEAPLTLAFDNGCTLSIVGRHDLLEQGSRKYVTITEANVGQYVGAKFYGEDGAWHTLMNATMGTAAVEFYSIYTTPDRNVFANGLLTVADDADFLLNLYALDENLKADPDQLAADIAKYGLYSYEESQEKFPGASRALYEALNGKYFKVAVGKQLVSWAYLQKTFTSVFRPTSSVSLPTSNVPRLTSLAAAPKLTSVTTEPSLDDFDFGVLTLGAGAVITNNTANGAKSNIHLVTASSGADSLIQFTESHAGVCAGVSCSWGVGPFTTNLNVTAADAALFTSDNPAYVVRFVTDHLVLAVPDVSFVPSSVDHATAAVYTSDAPVEAVGGAYLIPSNATATVVYTAEGEYVFAGGKKSVTNELDTAVDPATVKGVLPKVLDPVEYVAPAYVDNIASNGIAYWTTNMLYNYTVVTSAADRVTWGAAGKTSWYVVTNGTYQIDGGVQCTGNVHLVLCDGAKLTVTNVANSCAGIAMDASGSFTIYETVPGDAVSSPRQVGSLDVTGDSYAAGIGGNFTDVGSNITINGGIVTARTETADESGAGIGGGSFADGSNITINGGTVTATCSDMGAGIGGGYDSDGSGITINGGTVTTRGGLYAAGVGGGGEGGRCSHITVNGGTVTATGGEGAAGIGGGSQSVGSDIAIRGGTVTAIGGLTSPGIGGGGEGTGENVRIANAIVFVGTMDAIIDEGEGPCRYSADLIGGGGLAGDPSSDIVIDETAQVFFNLTGAWDYDNEVWIEEPAPMPENFEGFVIMTPATQSLDRVLVGGISALNPQLSTFSLTNAATGATGTIEVNGADVVFANKLLSLPHADGKLTLNAYEYSTINPPTEVVNTTAKVYTNAVEDATLVDTPIAVRQNADAYVVYTAAENYAFAGGLTVVTNTIDTSVTPATAPAPAAPMPIWVAEVTLDGETTTYMSINEAWKKAQEGDKEHPATIRMLCGASITNTLDTATKE